ncbi:hypothetical protein BEWA_033940 [Theileria equi strain WA]|uniref:Uncharacterized protein n=1 Tax=Theileria equi strain WA TaxID=1537102 RepID=L0AY78_THEEQ|nr:hypothetical protein BEWA_033940 [Theileria equi strain WA]AFZ80537.1 hypothetical protein BEWA_033940 [Theileria equi strain WA]|eukprot:XP_004830203.1 hypothetical protein BEWA_033940 [Theileria equi strain WA]
MRKPTPELSISEIQKEIERFSESEDSEAPSDESSHDKQTYDASFTEVNKLTSDEEAEVDLNDLTSLLTKSKRKAEDNVQDIDTLMLKTKFDIKRDSRANDIKKKKVAELMKHQANRELSNSEETYSSKAWHVPLLEVPKPEPPKSAKNKKSRSVQK